jgi:hypothetical protein
LVISSFFILFSPFGASVQVAGCRALQVQIVDIDLAGHQLVEQSLEQLFEQGMLLPVQGDLASMASSADLGPLLFRIHRIGDRQGSNDVEIQVLLLPTMCKFAGWPHNAKSESDTGTCDRQRHPLRSLPRKLGCRQLRGQGWPPCPG